MKENLPGINPEEILMFYDNYFDEHVKLGKQEEKIAEELGDPRLIRKTIIDTNLSKTTGAKATYSEKDNE